MYRPLSSFCPTVIWRSDYQSPFCFNNLIVCNQDLPEFANQNIGDFVKNYCNESYCSCQLEICKLWQFRITFLSKWNLVQIFIHGKSCCVIGVKYANSQLWLSCTVKTVCNTWNFLKILKKNRSLKEFLFRMEVIGTPQEAQFPLSTKLQSPSHMRKLIETVISRENSGIWKDTLILNCSHN